METVTALYILCITIYVTVIFVIQNMININTQKELDKLQIDNPKSTFRFVGLNLANIIQPTRLII